MSSHHYLTWDLLKNHNLIIKGLHILPSIIQHLSQMSIKKKAYLSTFDIASCYHDQKTYLWHWEVFVKNMNSTDYKFFLQVSGHKTGMHISNHHAYVFLTSHVSTKQVSKHWLENLNTSNLHFLFYHCFSLHRNVTLMVPTTTDQTCETYAKGICVGFSTQRQRSTNFSRPTCCFLL